MIGKPVRFDFNLWCLNTPSEDLIRVPLLDALQGKGLKGTEIGPLKTVDAVERKTRGREYHKLDANTNII